MTWTTNLPSRDSDPSDPKVKTPSVPTPTPKDTIAGPAPYPLRLVKSSGEESVGKPPAGRLATPSGGTSGAEDTTRTAGYVADLSKAPAVPPGPPVAREATELEGPEGTTPPPGEEASRISKAKPTTVEVPVPAVPPARSPRLPEGDR